MPLIRIDHNSQDIGGDLIGQLVKDLLAFALDLHQMNQDQISIFTQAYTPESHSTAAAEIEIRAKKLEYGENPEQRREGHLQKYQEFVARFIKANTIRKGIVLTLTLEDWSVKWVAGATEKHPVDLLVMSTLEQLLQFTSFSQAFREVKRQTWVKSTEEYENDSEHSYQLALISWYIIESYHLALDSDKVFKYALAHDLVEVYAGDTGVFSKDKQLKESRSQRESDARDRIYQEYNQFSELHTIIDEYEQKSNDEAKFVYALDKLLPVINNYLDGGRNWKKESITLEDVLEVKDSKIALSPEIDSIWQEFKQVLDQGQHGAAQDPIFG